ncbi:MAG: hypothetical protein ABFS46_05055 [Myxococcota bacterium]
MFTVALVGPDAIGTRVARELVRRLPVPAIHLRDGPRPEASNRLPMAGWLLRLLPSGTSSSGRVMGLVRRLAGWWYRRGGFIVILHGRFEVECFRGGGWRSAGSCHETSPAPRADLIVVLDEPGSLPQGLSKLRTLRSGPGRRQGPWGSGAPVIVLDARRPFDQLVGEVARPIRSLAARHLVPVEAPEPVAGPEPKSRSDVR